MSVKQYVFRRSLKYSLLLSTICYFVQIMTMTLILTVGGSFSWFESSCFSTIVMTTDSFAIFNVIHRLPERLMFQNVIQGEAILMVGVGLGFYRMFEQLHSSTSLHSTMFIVDTVVSIMGGIIISVGVFYTFNKFRSKLIESKFLFCVLIVVVCFYVCEIYFRVNGIIAVTVLGAMLITRYKPGTEERYNMNLIQLASSYIVVMACLMLGYMDYQNESITLGSFLQILVIYLLHTVVRALVILTSNFLLRGTSFEIPSDQLFLSVFGSMKGVNNIIILFFALNETAKETSFKLFLIRFTVHIIIINNLLSNLLLWKFQRFRPSSNELIILNKDSLTRMMQHMEKDLKKYCNDEVLCDYEQLSQISGLNAIRSFVNKIENDDVDRTRLSRKSSSDFGDYLILTDEAFIDIRQDTLKTFKKIIEDYAVCRPNEYRLLKQFCEMSQQHPDQQIRLFQQLKCSFIPMSIMRIVYKFKYFPIFVFEVYKILCEEIEFCLNLAQIYVESLQDLIMRLSMEGNHRYSAQCRKKIIEEMRDEIQSVQEYTLKIYQELPDTINQILNIRTARLIISDISSSLHSAHLFGQLNNYSREEFTKLFEFYDAKLSNISPSYRQLKEGTLVEKHKIFSCLSSQEITELLSESVTMKIKQGRNIADRRNLPQRQIFMITKGSFSEKISENSFSWKKKGQMLNTAYIVFDNILWEESVVADSESEVLTIPIKKVRKFMSQNLQLRRRIYSKCLMYFVQRNSEKAGQMVHYSDRQIKKLAATASLVICKNNDKIEIEYGAYVIMGQLISDQLKRNMLQGISRYDQFSYIGSKQKLICMRESVLLLFKHEVVRASLNDKVLE